MEEAAGSEASARQRNGATLSFWQMDDKFLGHHKVIRALRAGAEALLMWVALRSYVAHNETDGDVPDEDIDDLPGAPKNPRKWLKVLVECGKPTTGGRGAGLVEQTSTGWRFHNYEKRGLTRQQIETAREKAKARKEQWKERQGGTQPERRSERVPNTDGTSPRVGAPAGALPSHPIPSQDHTHTSELLEPTEEHRRLAGEMGVDAAAEFGRFRAHARGKGREMADEAACFDLWLRDEAKKAQQRQARGGPRGAPAGPQDAEAKQRLVNSAIEGVRSGAYGERAKRAAATLPPAAIGEFALRAESEWRARRQQSAEVANG